MTKLALIQPTKVKHWAPRFLARIKSELSQPGFDSSFQIVDRPQDADAVLYVDSAFHKSAKDLPVYQKLLEWAAENGKSAFVLSFEDRPLAALPGIYSSVESRRFDPSLHLSWPHLEAPNKRVECASQKSHQQASRLFTFAGSCSHRIRRKLFSIYGSGVQEDWKVVEVNRWYNHTQDEQLAYIDDILDSRFVLCPRGIASYSHRILETMLLERIPVIIADDWVPFSFPERDYFIRIAEKDVGNVVQRLQQELANYDFYLSNLRQINSKWFAKQTRYRNIVEHFLKFHRERQDEHDPRTLLERLKSHGFRRSNGLLSYQQILESANAIPRRGKRVLKNIFSQDSRKKPAESGNDTPKNTEPRPG